MPDERLSPTATARAVGDGGAARRPAARRADDGGRRLADGDAWWERLVDVLAEPRRAFAHVAERPRTLVALVAVAAVDLVRTLVAHSPALDPPRLAATALLHLIGAAASAALFASAIVLVAGGRPGLTFTRAYGVAAHAALPFALVACATSAVVAGLDVAAAGRAPGASLAWFAPAGAHPALQHALRSLDAGRAHQLALTAVGLRALGVGLSRAGAVRLVAAVWGGYLAVTLAIKFVVA